MQTAIVRGWKSFKEKAHSGWLVASDSLDKFSIMLEEESKNFMRRGNVREKDANKS